MSKISQIFNFLNFKILKKEIVVKTFFLGERLFYCKNDIEYFRTYHYGHEREALAVFINLLKQEDVIWDIGASIGLYSIYSASEVKKIIAFEPDNEIFERLNKNIKLNNFEIKIVTHQLGLSSEDGSVTLSSDGLNGSSPSISDIGRHNNSKSIEVRSIDSLIAQGVEEPTVLKIDIEGAEILALKGAMKLLKSPKAPRLIFMEVHPNFLQFFNSSEEEILKIITNSGYLIISDKIRDDQKHIIAIKC